MVNIDDFIKRLEIILDYYNLSASSFADKINVQRSSLSHLLSGRNKPSLDFITKVVEVFPEVDLYWILNGKGTFPKSDPSVISSILTDNTKITSPEVETVISKTDLFSIVDEQKEIDSNSSKQPLSESYRNGNDSDEEIERIVVFFKNGTFKNYKP